MNNTDMSNRNVILQVGPKPSQMVCPSCNTTIITRIENKTTTKTHLMAFILCICCPCFSCIPYFMDSCQNADHYCPNCNSYIGMYQN